MTHAARLPASRRLAPSARLAGIPRCSALRDLILGALPASYPQLCELAAGWTPAHVARMVARLGRRGAVQYAYDDAAGAFAVEVAS